MLPHRVLLGSLSPTPHSRSPCGPTGARWAVVNDGTGMAALWRASRPGRPPSWSSTPQAAISGPSWRRWRRPVAVVNPRHARAVAKATGQLAKTEARDARALAPVAEGGASDPPALA